MSDMLLISFGDARILDGPTVRAATAEILKETEQRACYKVLLNLRPIERLSDDGLGALITLHKTLFKLGRRLAIANAVPQIQEFLETTKINRIIKDEGEFDESKIPPNDEDDPDAEPNGVPARLIPPKPSNSGSLRLWQPPAEPE